MNRQVRFREQFIYSAYVRKVWREGVCGKTEARFLSFSFFSFFYILFSVRNSVHVE